MAAVETEAEARKLAHALSTSESLPGGVDPFTAAIVVYEIRCPSKDAAEYELDAVRGYITAMARFHDEVRALQTQAFVGSLLNPRWLVSMNKGIDIYNAKREKMKAEINFYVAAAPPLQRIKLLPVEAPRPRI